MLLNPLVQKTIKQLKEKYGSETVETFLKDNEKNIKNNIKQKLANPTKPKKKKAQKTKDEEVKLRKDKESKHVESDEDNAADSEEESELESEENLEKNLNISENNSSTEELTEQVKESEPVEDKVPEKKSEYPKKSKRKRFTEEVVKKTTDSFFVDSSGQNYLANAADGASSASEEDDTPAYVRKIPQKSNKIVQGKKFKPIQTKRFDETPPAKRPFQNKKPDFKAKQPQFKIDSQPIRKPEVKSNVSAKPSDGDIHPSWKAKAQMRKTQIQDYQGTKIKFDD